MYYEFEYDDEYENILSINIIKKNDDSLFSFEIKTIENKKIIDEIKLFTDNIKNGHNDVIFNIINDKFNKQYINYINNTYNFIIEFDGQTSGYYTSKYITKLNLTNMFENLIKDYKEKNIFLIKKNEKKYILEKEKENEEIKQFLNNFGSYKL